MKKTTNSQTEHLKALRHASAVKATKKRRAVGLTKQINMELSADTAEALKKAKEKYGTWEETIKSLLKNH